MKIRDITIKNFKSFGNNPQTLSINPDMGELVLLTGSNGNGKSSLIESFEYAFYGKVKSMKKKKWATNSMLPNRLNNNLAVTINFESDNNQIQVTRTLNPNTLKLVENGVEYDRAGKSNVDDRIEEYVGIDIETFKSFISMSVNDFKNFISLSNEEKQVLLDKLFNLEIINTLNKILKDMNKNNKNFILKYETEISSIESTIRTTNASIEKALAKEKEDNENKIITLEEDVKKKKELYASLKKSLAELTESFEKIEEERKQINEKLLTERDQEYKLTADINNIKKSIDLYDKQKCPTCASDFNTEHFIDLKNNLNEKVIELTKIKNEISNNINSLNEKMLKVKSLTTELKSKISPIEQRMNEIKYSGKSQQDEITRLKALNTKDDFDTLNNSINEFKKNITEYEKKKNVIVDNLSESKNKELYYKELSAILGEDGVKKSIIASIIKPLNFYIQENIDKLNLPFEVVLDDTFTAKIKSFGEEVEQDTLSTGENKKVNIIILIAYLKLIRSKRNINVLFLDEIFASIDIEGCEYILALLKSFANEYNITIFTVHHATFKRDMFDRIISIKKDVFTRIEEGVVEEYETVE